MQVDLAGDSMVAASMASTGEGLAFGGSGGYVHLWALSHQPSVNAYSQVALCILFHMLHHVASSVW